MLSLCFKGNDDQYLRVTEKCIAASSLRNVPKAKEMLSAACFG